jgi:hypothetical protein
VTQAGTDPIGDRILARLSDSPDAYPHKLDLVSLAVLVIEWSEAAYRAASFLDDRIFAPEIKGAWLPLQRVIETARVERDTRPVHFIFHTGHVGSTLVSRLLDETGGVLPLREPLPLRTLADAHDASGRPESLVSEAQLEEMLGTFLKLWARGYAATRAVVVKATSSTGRLAGRILAAGRSRAIYLNVSAEIYLATLLAGQNSHLDLRGHGPERIRRLRSRTAAPLDPLHALSLGELAAMSWLVESWSQHDAVEKFPSVVLPLDFDAFLADVEEGMRRTLDHLDLPKDERYLSDVKRSASLARYSKAPEYAYSPELRAQVLSESRRDNRQEIRKGLDWLERLARADGRVARILSR